VADWVTLGSDVMRAAQKRRGLSHEGVARLIPVSGKTYERYEKQGRVPRLLLAKVADVLELEIEQPETRPISVRVEAKEAGEDLAVALFDRLRSLEATVADGVADLRSSLDEVLRRLPPSV
jgi:DNA-binding XRE family transcriptional regulator